MKPLSKITVACAMFLLIGVVSTMRNSAFAQAWIETLNKSTWQSILAKAESGDAEYQYRAGVIFYKGTASIPRDLDKAVQNFLESAKHGYVEAMQNIGVMYIRGEGVQRDFREGLKWFERAAELGDVFAMHSLGLRYENGDGVLQDYEKAQSYYAKAAKLDFPPAMYALGMMYATGMGVHQDYVAAISWTSKSAEFGYPAALFNMGVAYAKGQGVKRDLVEAHKYFNLCVAYSDREKQEAMIEARKSVEKLMSQREISLAQERARTWIKQHHKVEGSN